MKENIIKVGFCAAYDWDLLKNSVPLVYNQADTICISIDKNRKSWSGTSYEIDNSAFYAWVKQTDVAGKIKIYEDDFSVPGLTSIQNDNRQRTMMAEFMGKDGWHIQIDSDEYFLDFEGFIKFLKKLNPAPKNSDKPVNVTCNSIPLIKRVEKGFLFVDFREHDYELLPLATNRPVYEHARINGHFNLTSNAFILHETWARGEEQLWQKLNSWGHDADFKNKQSYFNLWKVLDNYNYQYIKDIHPLNPTTWPYLDYCEGKDIQELRNNLLNKKHLHIPYFKRAIKNSKNISRFKAIISKLK